MKEPRMAGKAAAAATTTTTTTVTTTNTNKPSSSSQKPPSSSSSSVSASASHRKSRWESGNPPPPDPFDPKLPSSSAAAADAADPPPPTYGFHMLERRTIVLADGSVRSYFALPPDYPSPSRPPYPHPSHHHHHHHLSPDHPPDFWHPDFPPLKRKHPDDLPRDDLDRHRHHLLHYANLGLNGLPPAAAASSPPLLRDDDQRPAKQPRGPRDDGYNDLGPSRRVGSAGDAAGGSDPKNSDVNPVLLKKAFLQYVKSLNENAAQRRNFLEDGKYGALHCLVCDRDSKDYMDVHGLIMHAYNSQSARVPHLGFHKALCVLMGWNYMRAPDNSKAYRSLPEDEAAANQEDLIMWPPVVLLHNTCTGKKKDGRMDGMGNKDIDNKLRELGFTGGKSKSMYGKDGHMGVTVVKFASSQAGLEDAMRLVEFFEKDNRGRKGWARIQASQSKDDEENNPYLVNLDVKTGEKVRILYGYLGSAMDLDKVDFDTKKKALIKSRSDLDVSW